MALKDIKSKIKATERTNKVTHAMEAVSAVKMRKTQGAALADRAYARAALSILARLAGSSSLQNHPLMQVRTSDVLTSARGTSDVRKSKIALVVITSDKGLAGALNSGVLKAAVTYFDGHGVSVNSVMVYAYGRKGEEYFRRNGYRINQAFENKKDDVELSVVEELARELSAGFVAGDFDEAIAVYSNFKSTFEQAPTARTLLPLSVAELAQVVADIVPAKGKYSDTKPIESPAAYTIEPEATEVLDALVPRLLAVSVYHMMLEAKASEHSARMVAMKNASDKSEEVAHDLTRLYNKRRQAAITREVSEIVGGREALAS